MEENTQRFDSLALVKGVNTWSCNNRATFTFSSAFSLMFFYALLKCLLVPKGMMVCREYVVWCLLDFCKMLDGIRWVESVLGERSKQVWALNKIVVDFLTSKVNFNQVLIFQHLKCDLSPAWLFFKMWQFNSSQAEFLKKHRSCNVWYCVRKLDN